MNKKISNINSEVKQPFSFRNWIINFGEVVALGIVAILASSFFKTHDAFDVTLAIVVAYLFPRFIYVKGNSNNNLGQWLLLIVALLLAVYVLISIKAWTIDSGGSFEYPRLKSDDGGYYRYALSHYDGRCPEPKVGFKGLSLLMILLWKCLGVSIVWPIALNYMLTLLSIVMTGKLAERLFYNKLKDIDPKIISVIAMLIVSLMGFLISQSLRLQKEAACTLGIVLVGYVLAGVSRENKETKWVKKREIAIFSLGCLILSFVRTSYAYFAVIGAVMMVLANHGKSWKNATLLCAIALLITFLFSFFFAYSFGQQYRTVDGGDPMAKAFAISFEQQPYAALVGDYFFYPIWKRLLLLPVTAGVQYIIPFPWLYEQSEMSSLSVLPRVRIVWYFVGGVCLFYYLYISILHNKQNHLGVWSWWPLVAFLIIAYITGGTVSRYILPLQPLFAVVALYVLIHVWKGKFRRSFTLWIIVYSFILIALLLVCYNIQSEYLHSIRVI